MSVIQIPNISFNSPLISRVDFVNRFTDDEYVAILTASKTDVIVEAWFDKLYMSSQINLIDEKTINGINMLVSKGLLTEERSQQILEYNPL